MKKEIWDLSVLPYHIALLAFLRFLGVNFITQSYEKLISNYAIFTIIE